VKDFLLIKINFMTANFVDNPVFQRSALITLPWPKIFLALYFIATIRML
jgi:hypothetical protein